MFGILMILRLRAPCSVHWSFTQLAILLACLCTAGVSTQDYKATCNVPSVKPLEDAVLTCHFPEDLGVSKKDFTVYHYDKSGSPEAVIDCWWINDKLDCYAQPAIEYNTTVGTDLTLIFKRLTTEMTGKYTCQAAGYGPGATEPCVIQFQFERENLCKVDYKTSKSKAVLTCFFNEDVANTRRNFAVYKQNGQDKEIVVECAWEDRQTRCRVENGYQYNHKVSSYLILEITEVTKKKEGNYSCWHSSSESLQQKTCSLYANDKEWGEPTRDEDQTINALAIGLSLGLLILVLLVACGIFLTINKGGIRSMIFKRESPLARPDIEEGQQLLDNEETTPMFQEYLEEQVKGMYPNMFESHYFVPPVYFNKTRYKTQSVAGQVVYVPEPCDPSDVHHDRAMQHVLHCLHRLAEHEDEQMFVLTQFQYDDYLNNPGNKYEQHRLPAPSGLKNVENQVGCFDLLIVNRIHGVLAGVVKSVGNMENQDDEETADKCIASQVTEAVQQLIKAERMLKHLMQDGCSLTQVDLTLILPSLTRSSLRRAVEKHEDLVEILRGFRGEDPLKLCLCAEDLSDPRKPWEVSNKVIENILGCWKWLVHRTQANAIINDDLYLKLISRFFGPATRSALRVPGEYEHIVLPKTLSQAVSLTGDLYGRLVLHPDITELLQKRKLFLAGPPNSGKTEMLTLAGCQWLSQGHDVYIVNDILSKGYSFLATQLKSLTEAYGKGITTDSTFGCTHHFQCNFATDKSVNQSIKGIVSKTKGKRLCILLDGVHLDGKRVQTFCKTLDEQVSDLYLWVTCIGIEYLIAGYTMLLTTIHSCPPAVLREVKEAEVLVNTYAGLYLYPTDGPTVKHFSLNRSIKSGKVSSTDCLMCGKEVGKFLTKLLLITGTDDCKTETCRNELKSKEVMMETFQNAAPLWTAGSHLQLGDILILFEFKFTKNPDVPDDHSFLKGLRESGITVRAVRTDGKKEVAMDDSDTAWAMHIRHMETFRVRRKIIVYVETDTEVKEVETKRRALTSCTSQLVLVHSKPV